MYPEGTFTDSFLFWAQCGIPECSGNIKIISVTVQSFTVAISPDLKLIFIGNSLLQVFTGAHKSTKGGMLVPASPKAIRAAKLCRTFSVGQESCKAAKSV